MHNPSRQLGPLNLFESQPGVKVQVGCNGHKEIFFFLVDTGCTSTMINTNSAKNLGLTLGNESYAGLGAYSRFFSHKANLPWLKLGPIEKQNLTVQVMDLSKADIIGDIDGILGVNFWQNHALTIDFKKNELQLNSDQKSKKHIWVIPAGNDGHGRLYVNGIINRLHRVRMLVDTCSPTTTMPYDLAAEIFAAQIEKKKFHSSEWDINGGKAQATNVQTQSFQIGDYACTGLTIDVTKNNKLGSNDCILGSDFLRNFRVTFDFPNQCLTLEQ
jgi:predicted aspartyl protease